MASLSAKPNQEYGKDLVTLRFAARGAGAANMTVFRQAQGDMIESCVYSATGVYTITLKSTVPLVPQKLIDADIKVHGDGVTLINATTEAADGYVRDLAINGRTFVVQMVSASGAAAAVAANDWVTFVLVGPRTQAIAASDAV